MNAIDLPVSAASTTPSGAKTPKLMALFRNSTFAGSTSNEASGSNELSTRNLTPAPKTFEIAVTAGPIPRNPPIAASRPVIPRLKFPISISKPAGVTGSSTASIFFRTHAAKGPISMAPRNIGIVDPTITPTVATAPITAPR